MKTFLETVADLTPAPLRQVAEYIADRLPPIQRSSVIPILIVFTLAVWLIMTTTRDLIIKHYPTLPAQIRRIITH